MEAAIPNLLTRNVSDPIDSPFDKGSATREASQDPHHHHHDHSIDVSFWRIATGEGGSPRSLCVELKERKETPPRSINSSEFRVWGKDHKGRKDGDADDTDRVLSLRNWTDAAGVDGDHRKGEQVEKGRFGHGGATPTPSTAVGVSQG